MYIAGVDMANNDDTFIFSIIKIENNESIVLKSSKKIENIVAFLKEKFHNCKLYEDGNWKDDHISIL